MKKKIKFMNLIILIFNNLVLYQNLFMIKTWKNMLISWLINEKYKINILYIYIINKYIYIMILKFII